MNIETIWKNIVKNEGEPFYTVKEKIRFVYTISGDSIELFPDTGVVYVHVHKNDFSEVLKNIGH